MRLDGLRKPVEHRNDPATGRAVLAERWDAGELGCSRLILALRERLSRVGPGESVEVIARDPGAQVDIPAWCRTTGHTLVSAKHPVYVVQRRAN
jgi:tRNA 2-thiouridine synthesizing protein A